MSKVPIGLSGARGPGLALGYSTRPDRQVAAVIGIVMLGQGPTLISDADGTGAALRLSGAAHQRGQRRTDTRGLRAPGSRGWLNRQRTRIRDRHARLMRADQNRQDGQCGLGHLQMRQRSPADAALLEGRVVTRWHVRPHTVSGWDRS